MSCRLLVLFISGASLIKLRDKSATVWQSEWDWLELAPGVHCGTSVGGISVESGAVTLQVRCSCVLNAVTGEYSSCVSKNVMIIFDGKNNQNADLSKKFCLCPLKVQFSGTRITTYVLYNIQWGHLQIEALSILFNKKLE